jgi:spore coat protein U-like protein
MRLGHTMPIAIGCIAVWTTPASALSCSFAMTDLDFGDIDPTLNQNIDTTGTLTISCNGIGTTQQIRICAHVCQGSGGMNGSASIRNMLSGSTQLQFNIYRNDISTGVWGARGTPGNFLCGSGWGSLSLNHAITSPPDSLGNYNATVTAYGRVFAGQTTLPAGTYTSTFTGTTQGPNRAAAVYQIFASQNCGSITSNPTNFPFTATATVVPTCRVSATDLDFGTQTLLSDDVDATSTVSVTCTSGQSYALSLNEGTGSGGTTTTRLMTHTSSAETVPYQMYSDAARTQNWGNSATNDVEGTGTGSAIGHTVYGRVPAQATAPDAGSYIDTVTVTVTY